MLLFVWPLRRLLVRINDTRALKAHIRMTQDPKKEIQEKAIEGLIKIYVADEEGGFISGVKKVGGCRQSAQRRL